MRPQPTTQPRPDAKTSVLAKIVEHLASGAWKFRQETRFNIVIRFLGTTPNSCNLHQLLVSLCQQLVRIYDVKKWEEPEKVTDLIKEFHWLLSLASAAAPLMLVLDSIDQLMPAYNAYKVKWLPKVVPRHVKVIVSTIVEGYPIYDSLKALYTASDNFIEVTQLGEKLGLEIVYQWLRKNGRTMTSEQEQVISKALQRCSLPLYARIAYDHIQRYGWFPAIDRFFCELISDRDLHCPHMHMNVTVSRGVSQLVVVSGGSRTTRRCPATWSRPSEAPSTNSSRRWRTSSAPPSSNTRLLFSALQGN